MNNRGASANLSQFHRESPETNQPRIPTSTSGARERDRDPETKLHAVHSQDKAHDPTCSNMRRWFSSAHSQRPVLMPRPLRSGVAHHASPQTQHTSDRASPSTEHNPAIRCGAPRLARHACRGRPRRGTHLPHARPVLRERTASRNLSRPRPNVIPQQPARTGALRCTPVPALWSSLVR